MRLQKTLTILTALFSTCTLAETQRLINTRDMYPSPSPAGDQVVFQSNRVGVNQVFIMDIDPETGVGNNIRQLTNVPLGAETPVFSPDGKSIVYAAYVGEDNNDVFTMDPDGSNKKRLTEGPGYDGHPHWNADGSRIAFNSDRSSPDPDAGWSDRWHEIYSMNADGSDVQKHTNCQSVCTYGSLSPDGQTVLYRKVIDGPAFNWGLNATERNSEVFVSNLDGSNERNISNNAAFDGWPVWSPDGSMIAIASNRSGPANTGQIWLINPDGSESRQISEAGWGHAQPAWSADGKSIYTYQFEETPEYEFGSVVRIHLADR
jgi:TolB protein